MSNSSSAEALNIAIVRGVVSSDPRVRELASGGTVTNVEVTTRLASGSVSVPVVVQGTTVGVAQGDEVVVTGHIARRFFRAGGVTQSRTELVAATIAKSSATKTVTKALARATAQLG